MALSPVLTKVAEKLIKKFGRSMTIITKVDAVGGYNPDTGTDYTSTETTTDIIGFLSTYQTREYIDGMITLGDMPLYTVNPINKENTVSIGSDIWAVTMVQEYNLESSVVLYIANLRKV
jgi:hypothetical protein